MSDKQSVDSSVIRPSPRRFVRDVGALGVAQAVAIACGVVQGLLVARWLGPAEYGLAALLAAYPGLTFALLDARSDDASIRYLSRFDAEGEPERALAMIRVGVLVDLALAVASALFVFLTASWAARQIAHAPGSGAWIAFAAMSPVLRSPRATTESAMVVTGHFDRLAILQVGSNIARTTLSLAIVAAGGGARALVAVGVLASALEGIAYLVVLRAVVGSTWGVGWWRARPGVLRSYRREIAHFLAFSDLGALVGVAAKQIDVVVLGSVRGQAEVGWYRLARSLSGMVGNVVAPLQRVAYQRLVRVEMLDPVQIKALAIRYLVRGGLPLGMLVVTGGVALAPIAIPGLAGRGFEPAVLPTQLLLVSASIWLVGFPLRPWAMAVGALPGWTAISAGVSVATVIGYFIAAPGSGALGIAWTQVICAGFGGHFAAVWYLSRRATPSSGIAHV